MRSFEQHKRMRHAVQNCVQTICSQLEKRCPCAQRQEHGYEQTLSAFQRKPCVKIDNHHRGKWKSSMHARRRRWNIIVSSTTLSGASWCRHSTCKFNCSITRKLNVESAHLKVKKTTICDTYQSLSSLNVRMNSISIVLIKTPQTLTLLTS